MAGSALCSAPAMPPFALVAPRESRYAGEASRSSSVGEIAALSSAISTRAAIDAEPTDTVLDVATGTGAVARELLRQKGCTVVGLDQSPEMLAEARRRLPKEVQLVEASAEQLPFPDASFDALTFTYLLRYVSD